MDQSDCAACISDSLFDEINAVGRGRLAEGFRLALERYDNTKYRGSSNCSEVMIGGNYGW